MTIQPLMLFAAIAFWGWQSGQWLAAGIAAGLICASFYTALRWQQSAAHLYRVADFCTVLALLLGGYFYVTYGNPRAIILFFMWLPMMFLPLALMHAYGDAKRMNLAVLFWSLRRRPPAKPASFDPWFPYYAMWIVAASAANARSEWFYVGLVALVSWPLVRVRPWSYRVGSWGVAFSIAIALGYGLHHGLHETQLWLEDAVPEWISGGGSRTDPFRSVTDIGHIGKLKDSDAIVLRVTAKDGAKAPGLLHRASYNAYSGAAWIARSAGFSPVGSSPQNLWPLAREHGTDTAASRVTVHDYTLRPNPVLSLPAGTIAVERLTAISMQRNPLGAVQIVREPGFFAYTAAFAGTHAFDGAPTPEDRRLPPKEREAFVALADELGVKNQPQPAIVERIKHYFATGYHYSTYQKSALLTGSPIVDFLLRSKSGHCEYFATATVLLLRAAGIPARYATGFAVTERSERENAWIVRQRHAHAWVRAYVDGAWIEIDTTPASWSSIEAEDSGAWTKVTDLWSWLRFRTAQAWANSDERQWLVVAIMVVFPFALWLAWRLYHSRRGIQNSQQKQIVTSHLAQGADSEFYRIEQRLTEQGWARRPYETAQDLLARLKADANMDTAALADIVELHNRYRFDPMGLTEAQRARLKDTAGGWIASNTNTATT